MKFFKKLCLWFIKHGKIDLKYRRVEGEKYNVHIDVYLDDVFSHTVNVLAMPSKKTGHIEKDIKEI